MKIPDIILRKIYWYIWIEKQCELCIEYRSRCTNIENSINNIKIQFIEINTCLETELSNIAKNIYKKYNWRDKKYAESELLIFNNLHMQYKSDFIYNKNHEIISDLNINY